MATKLADLGGKLFCLPQHPQYYPCKLKDVLLKYKDAKTGFGTAAEIGLLLERPRGKRIALEIKLSSAPKPSRGFWSAIGDLNPSAAYVVYPGKERFALGQGVEALSVFMLGEVLRN